MSTPTPPLSPTTIAHRRTLLHYTSLLAVIACPLLIALPPRKLDIYTVAALASTAAGGDYLVREYTGRSVVDRVRFAARGAGERERAEVERARGLVRAERAAGGRGEGAERVEREVEARVERIEGSEWKRAREERERKALGEGRGYADLIVDQICEVWGTGKSGKGEGGKEEGEGKDK